MTWRTAFLMLPASLLSCGSAASATSGGHDSGADSNADSGVDSRAASDAPFVDVPGLDGGPGCPDDPCTTSGCSPVLLYSFDPNTESGLAVGTHELCVAFGQNGTGNTEYVAFNRCGGDPTMTAVSTGYAGGMLLDGDELTTAAGDSAPNPFENLSRRDLTSAEPAQATLLWSASYPFEFDNLTRGGDSLYFSYTNPCDEAHQGIYSAPYGGGAPTLLFDWGLQEVAQAMVLVGPALYFSYIPPGGDYGLYSMPTSGGTPKLLGVPKKDSLMNVVATDGNRLYWGGLGSASKANGSVGSMKLDGSDPVLLASMGAQVLDLVVDADAVYFTTDGVGGAVIASLYAVPSSGGSVKTLLSGVPRVDLLAQDADYLFFVGMDGVYRLRKPGHGV
jgi:hypothetical protein